MEMYEKISNSIFHVNKKINFECFLFLFFYVLISSCSKGQLSSKDYFKFKSSKIDFPKSMEQCGSFNKYQLKNSYKMLIFRDSLSCTPCYVKSLDDWKVFLSAFKTNSINLVFVLTPKQDEYTSVKAILHNRNYEWSIYIDKMNAFWQANTQIPKDGIYHCALLDKYNHVVIIGNPLKNKTIFNMMVKRVNSNN